MIYHDQLYLFLSLASATSFLWFIRSARPVALYVMTFTVLATSFTRPAGMALFPFLLLCAWAVRRGAIKHYLIAVALFAALTYGNYEYRRVIMGLQPGEPMPSYTGHQILRPNMEYWVILHQIPAVEFDSGLFRPRFRGGRGAGAVLSPSLYLHESPAFPSFAGLLLSAAPGHQLSNSRRSALSAAG